MKLDQSGIDFIKAREGFRSKPYLDGSDHWTIGWGHTDGVSQYTPEITQEQGELLLREDLEDCEHLVDLLVTVPVSQNEFNALVSFVFNEGTGKFRTSTLLLKLNAGDKQGAAKEFDRWIYERNPLTGQEEVDQGLVNRRAAEKALFLQDFEDRRKSTVA